MDFSSWIRRNLLSKSPEHTTNSQRPAKSNQSQQEEEIHGVTQPLIDHINTFTFATFKNFQLQDKAGQSGGDETGTSSSDNVRHDLSEWQQRHANLVLSRVQELSQLRFKLCPRHLKEQQFWCIYFMLVKSHVAEYELRDRELAKLKKMEQENVEAPKMSGYEVEMAETKQVRDLAPQTG